MEAYVHDTALIHRTAILGQGVVIGPNVVIEENVRIGAYSCIGTHPEHKDFFTDDDNERGTGVIVRRNVRIFEFVTIHSGTRQPTEIQEHSSIFQHAHIAHDCHLEQFCVIGGRSSLAGHTHVMQNAIVAGHSCTHQWSVIGAFSMLSPMSFLKGHIPPGELWVGNPARPAGYNSVGLQRANISVPACQEAFQNDFLFLKSGRPI